MKEKYSCYEFGVIGTSNGFEFEIYSSCPDYRFYMNTNVLIESEEWFDSYKEAREGAIKRIDLLENGE